MTSSGLLLVFDFAEEAGLAAAKEAAKQFGNLFLLQARPCVSSLRVGICSLCKPAHVPKVQLQVKLRPAELSLRDYHAALDKLKCGTSSDEVDSMQAALAVHSLLQLAAADKEMATAQQRTIAVLTDRQYDADEWPRVLQAAQEKGTSVDLYFACPADRLEAVGGGWEALEAQSAAVSVTVMESPGREAYRGLAAAFLERYGQLRDVAVNLQFKVPLLGDVRSLQLTARSTLQSLQYSVEHAPICSCHKLPGVKVPGPACRCAASEKTLSSADSSDARTIQMGLHSGGMLHFSSAFNFAVGAAGQALLTVGQRIKLDELNPACMIGPPLLLNARACQLKVMHEGMLYEVTHEQLLQSLAAGLRASGEALIASTTSSLESGQPTIFKQFYAISPEASSQPQLHAYRFATAEELPAPGPPRPVAALPGPLISAVHQQLAGVPLGPFDPLAYSSRCHATIEMLVRDSKPLPRPQVLLAPPACVVQAGSEAMAASDGAAKQLPAAAGAPAGATPTPAHQQSAPPGRPFRLAVGDINAPTAGRGRRSGAGQAKKAGAQKQAAASRAGLELKRIQR